MMGLQKFFIKYVIGQRIMRTGCKKLLINEWLLRQFIAKVYI